MAESLPSLDDIQEAAEEYYLCLCHFLMEREKELKKSSEAELCNKISFRKILSLKFGSMVDKL